MLGQPILSIRQHWPGLDTREIVMQERKVVLLVVLHLTHLGNL